MPDRICIKRKDVMLVIGRSQHMTAYRFFTLVTYLSCIYYPLIGTSSTSVSLNEVQVIRPYNDIDCNAESSSEVCLNPTKCNETAWKRKVFLCTRAYAELWCCGSGMNITWSKLKDGVWVQYPWETHPGYSTLATLGDKNQRLMMTSGADPYFDFGDYRCKIQQENSRIIHHEYNVEIHTCTCDEIGTSPAVLNPASNYTVRWNMPGQTSLLPCEVSFAYCPREDLKMMVEWMYQTDTMELKPVADLGPRFKVNIKKSYNFMNVTLRIDDIHVNDYRDYVCVADNKRRQVQWMISFEKGYPGNQAPDFIDRPAFHIVIGVVLGVIVLPVVFLGVLWLNRLSLLLWYHSKYGMRKERAGVFENDVIFIHADKPSDYAFVRNILFERLDQRYGYKTFLPNRDLPLGGFTLDDYYYAMERSSRVIFVVSKNFLSEALCGRLFSFSTCQENRLMDRNVYILYEDLPESLWNDNFEFVDLQALRAAINNARKSWLKIGKCFDWRNKYCSMETFDINIKYQKEVEVFWKKLCLALPPKPGLTKFEFGMRVNGKEKVFQPLVENNLVV